MADIKNGVVSVSLTKRQCKLIGDAIDVAQSQLKRAIAKETDDVIRERREDLSREFAVIDAIVSGQKEL